MKFNNSSYTEVRPDNWFIPLSLSSVNPRTDVPSAVSPRKKYVVTSIRVFSTPNQFENVFYDLNAVSECQNFRGIFASIFGKVILRPIISELLLCRIWQACIDFK